MLKRKFLKILNTERTPGRIEMVPHLGKVFLVSEEKITLLHLVERKQGMSALSQKVKVNKWFNKYWWWLEEWKGKTHDEKRVL